MNLRDADTGEYFFCIHFSYSLVSIAYGSVLFYGLYNNNNNAINRYVCTLYNFWQM